ncbi:MAG: hypothetical protein WKG07_30250 [Hymenobacter sp.]
MLPEETPTPAPTPADQTAADPQRILEARLAELRARPATDSAEPTAAAPALGETPPAAAVPPAGRNPDRGRPLLSEPGLAEALGRGRAQPVHPGRGHARSHRRRRDRPARIG